MQEQLDLLRTDGNVPLPSRWSPGGFSTAIGNAGKIYFQIKVVFTRKSQAAAGDPARAMYSRSTASHVGEGLLLTAAYGLLSPQEIVNSRELGVTWKAQIFACSG